MLQLLLQRFRPLMVNASEPPFPRSLFRVFTSAFTFWQTGVFRGSHGVSAHR